MNRSLAWFTSLALGAILVLAAAARSARPGPMMAEAAAEFLGSLTSDQREKAAFPFVTEERVNWHFIPRARKGLSLKDLSAAQRERAHTFLRAVLSQRGYAKATTIISLEEVLRELEQGRGPARDPELYYLSFFGQPSAKETWGWRLEGHHLSLNFTIVKGELVASTPQFFGANPAEVKDGPRRGLRALKAEEDLARQLLHALDDAQRARALIASEAPGDILTGASRRADVGEAKGLPASEMTEKQRALLEDLLEVYAEAMPKAISSERLAKLRKAGIEKIRYAWAGGAERGRPHYYRIQGPTFLVEYDNTQNNANHIHAVWRDFHGDFGDDLLAAHYRAYHLAAVQKLAPRLAPRAVPARAAASSRVW